MPSRESVVRIDAEVDGLKIAPGRWILLGTQISNGRGRPYSRRGCVVRYEHQWTPGTSDVSVCWPVQV